MICVDPNEILSDAAVQTPTGTVSAVIAQIKQFIYESLQSQKTLSSGVVCVSKPFLINGTPSIDFVTQLQQIENCVILRPDVEFDSVIPLLEQL